MEDVKILITKSTNITTKDIPLLINQVEQEIQKEIIGQEVIVKSFLRSIVAGGHILIEGVPGLAKTVLIKTVAAIFGCQFNRIQFTADLLPTDIIGINTFSKETSSFKVIKGPVFTNLLLADEINRASAKVQSALLECMAEKQTTIGQETIKLPDPFFVFATQNPLESLGTYPLPQAQLDRFLFKLLIDYPKYDEEIKIVSLVKNASRVIDKDKFKTVISVSGLKQIQSLCREVYVDLNIKKYATNIVHATRYPKRYNLNLGKYISVGCGPRATIGLIQAAQAEAIMNGRTFVVMQDIRTVCHDVLRHRIEIGYLGQSKNIKIDTVINELLDMVPIYT